MRCNEPPKHVLCELILPKKFTYSCQIVFYLALKLQECLLVMARNDSTSCCRFQTLETLSAAEPCWMVSRKPTLWDSITPLCNSQSVYMFHSLIHKQTTYILDDMAVITNKEEGSTVEEIELHADETYRLKVC